MVRSKKYIDELFESLQDPPEAVAYLNAALQDEEPEVFLLALRDVADAHGGIGRLAENTNLNRENLYRILSGNGNPQLISLAIILDALGLKLSVALKEGKKKIS